MRVSEVMSTVVEFVEPDVTVAEAAALMGELDVGALPVGSAKKLEGVITDRDILYRLVSRGLDPSTVRLTDIVSRPVIVCRDSDSVRSAMDLMAANHIRRLAVENEIGRVVGWLTLSDLSRKLLVDSAPLQDSLAELTGENAEPAAASS